MTFEQSLRELIKEAVVEATTPLKNEIGDLRKQIKSLLNQMSIRQAAQYVGVSEQAIRNWMSRGENDNPFPVRYAGADPRFIRAEIDEWEIREAKRRGYKSKRLESPTPQA